MQMLDFRLWDEVNEKMIYIADFEMDKDHLKFWFNKMNGDLEVEDLMLYSGLKDDANLKIYDGDIVLVRNERESKDEYLSVVTVDPILGTTITAHPKLQKMGITFPIPLIEYTNKFKNTTCKKVGNICTYPDLLDKIEEELNNAIMSEEINDDLIEIAYGKHKKYQERHERLKHMY